MRGYPVLVEEVPLVGRTFTALLDDETEVVAHTLSELSKRIMAAEDAALKGLMLPHPDPCMPDPIKTPCMASSQVFEWLYGKHRPDLDATECRVRILVDGKEVQAREWYVANGEIVVEGVTE